METPPAVPPLPPESPSPAPGGGAPVGSQWAVITHLSALAGLVVPAGNIIAPLIIWLIKKPEMPSLDLVGRSVLNFQISWSIWMIVSAAVGVFGSCLLVPILLPIGMGIAWLVFTILGGVKASNGEIYTFPLTLKIM